MSVPARRAYEQVLDRTIARASAVTPKRDDFSDAMSMLGAIERHDAALVLFLDIERRAPGLAKVEGWKHLDLFAAARDYERALAYADFNRNIRIPFDGYKTSVTWERKHGPHGLPNGSYEQRLAESHELVLEVLWANRKFRDARAINEQLLQRVDHPRTRAALR